MADPAQLLDGDRVTLSIGGLLYDGWKDIEIRRSLDSLASTFTLSLAERGSSDSAPFAFEAGAACEVRVGSERLITGWIDTLSPGFDANAHGISLNGRDKAGDLIDCSAVHKPASWSNIALETIASELAAPFGLMVTAKASTAPRIKKFALQQGETVFAAIERLCRFRGLLPVSTADGNVELIAVTAGAAVERLAWGVNITGGQATHDVSGRHSDYIVKAQAAGDDDSNGAAVSAVSGTAKDPAIKRYRPLIVMGEEQTDRAGATRRAKWEAVTRAGRSQTATITVPGWRTPGGLLRDRGMCFDVFAPWLFIDGKMMASEVALRFGAAGQTSEISLALPEAFTQLDLSETAGASHIRRTRQ